jgi:hypothetical protein
MKTSMQNLVCAFTATILVASSTANAATVFSDDFEGDLSRWTGQGGGSHSGVIMPDPVGSGRGNVLAFSNLTIGGDIFTANVFSLSGTVTISFDYLGLTNLGGVYGDLGGFLGVFDGLYLPTADNWKAGTQDSYPSPTMIHLIDDGAWRRYTITLSGTEAGAFRLALEDFSGSGGVPGDALFDNIQIQTVPAVPAVLSIGVSADGYPDIEITGTAGALYRVEYATELPTTNWTAITNVVLSNSPSLFLDVEPIRNTAKKFYRAVVVQ